MTFLLPSLQMVAAFTRGDVKLEVEKGGKFEFFGGNISGEFEELVSIKLDTMAVEDPADVSYMKSFPSYYLFLLH